MNNYSDQDVFLLKIAEIFKSAVLSFGVEANTADMAHKAFYALWNYQMEESKFDNGQIYLRQFSDQRLIQSQSHGLNEWRD